MPKLADTANPLPQQPAPRRQNRGRCLFFIAVSRGAHSGIAGSTLHLRGSAGTRLPQDVSHRTHQLGERLLLHSLH